MAQKRMFSLKIVDTDAFLDMPQSTQNLYFHLGMRADDEGFVGNIKRIMKMLGSSDDDRKVLLAKRFILEFESGVVVIKHWLMNNYLQNDRIKETAYSQEKSLLYVKENGAYTLDKEQGIPLLSQMDTKCIHRLDKNSIEEISIEQNREKESKEKDTPIIRESFKKPTIEEIDLYCKERQNKVNPQRFYDFYESKGWFVGKNKMKDWKACVRTWEQKDEQRPTGNKPPEYTEEELKFYGGK